MWRRLRSVITRLAICSVVLNVATIVGPTAPTPSTAVREQKVTIGALTLGLTKPVTVGIDAEMVALSWAGEQEGVSFSVRALDRGTWTEWLSLDGASNDQASKLPRRGQGAAGPAWLALDLRTFEVRLDSGAPLGLVFHALDVKRPNDGGGFALGPDAADAQIRPPFIASQHELGRRREAP